jgi:hypothetical protein
VIMSNNLPLDKKDIVAMYVTFSIFFLTLIAFSFCVGYMIWDAAN